MAEMVKTRINGRWNIILPKHRAERPEWDIKNGGWEKPRLDHFYGIVKEFNEIEVTPIVYYVGAEEGDMCGLIEKWGARVVMFEPNEKVMPNIKAIWEANKLNDSIFFPGFASDITTEGAMDYLSKVSDITGEVIHDHGFRELKDASRMPQVRLDDFAETRGEVPHIISLDVEGSEGRVLRGAENILKTHRPFIILSLHPEFILQQYGEWGGELREWIKAFGYDEVLVDYQHEVHLVYYPKESNE